MQRHCLTAVIALTALAPSAACNDHPVVDVPYHSIVINECPLVVNPSREVDILFVIDNSGSMGEEQALLAANFERFIGVLEEPGVDADYRIAITTTDTGNLYCPQSDPENGAFVLESCVDRLDEFTSGDDDKSAEACLELCPTSFSGFGTTPTALVDGGERIARPWIERLGGQPNLPEEMDTVQAFQCFGPQGIAGCGFESPLEAMYSALQRTKEAGDPAYGFLRKDALLSIVFITDENDCSASPDGAAIFDPNGDHVFWSDPDAKAPTSAACWNAGVACDDSGCWSEDYAADGTATESDAAVLHPLKRYVDLLLGQIGKDPSQILVSVIAGVPEGYPAEPIVYQASADSEFQRLYGVGAGCTSATGGTATPPVRLKEFADAFAGEEVNLFSICADD
ncbi:MAG: VWA domain-containing protein, partial [Myxococcales bacterium]|nr:VWA domain-containing protein [Myxococcales bacterium]